MDSTTGTTFDFIVIGAGSAGCAVAGRLAERGSASVAVLEAGPHDGSAIVAMPAGIAVLAAKKGERNYGYRSQRQPQLKDRRAYMPRGRGLGGSSSINGMVYIRGTPSDYDGWAALGCGGWGWEDVLPYFKRAECNERVAGRDDDPLHGGTGPLSVSNLRTPNPFSRHFLDAAGSASYASNPDFNGPEQEGFGYYQVTQRNGERWNAARAYLHGGQMDRNLNGGRSNLHVLPGSQVLRIVFEGRRAVGVVVVRNGQEQTLRARREIILSSGAFGSPQLLMASGIGPAVHLAAVGIPVLVDAPGVGQNLQEHADVTLYQSVSALDLFGVSLRGGLKMMGELWRYQRERAGMLTSNIAEAGGFVKSDPALADPDLQLHFAPALVGRGMRRDHGYSCHVCVLRPHSRGSMRLVSPDARIAPQIDLNLLADPRDMESMVAGVRMIQRIFEQPALARFGGKPVYHGHLKLDGSDDEAVRELIRQHADNVFHPVGTCRMGSDAASVLDPQLRVRGVEGLRVADASIMPTLVGGNTNAAAIMIGEKAADLISAASS